MKPEISIVMTSYNKERFIGEAIKSVLDQTFGDWELIIVDDASTDNSVDVVRSFDDERIRLEVLERNGHVSNAHNAGNALCRGEYIALLDSDDIWRADKLEKQLAYMKEHPDTGLCFTKVEVIDENGELSEDQEAAAWFDVENRSREEWIRHLILTENHFAKDSVLMRKEVVDYVGDNDLCMLQLHDYDYWMRALRKYSVHVMDEPMLQYRRAEENAAITSQNDSNISRHKFEYPWIVSREIREMDDEAFLRIFRDDLIDKNAAGHAAAVCEKALFLASDKPAHSCSTYAFEMFRDILNDPELRQTLLEKYDTDQHYVYRLTGMPDQRTAEQKQALEEELQAIKNSKSWKYTEVLRSIGRRAH